MGFPLPSFCRDVDPALLWHHDGGPANHYQCYDPTLVRFWDKKLRKDFDESQAFWEAVTAIKLYY